MAVGVAGAVVGGVAVDALVMGVGGCEGVCTRAGAGVNTYKRMLE